LGALTWRQSGLYVNAETLWQGTRAANQGCWLAYYHLGLLYLERGSLDEAIVQFQDALRIKPHYAEARNNLGAALLQKGALDEAMAQYQEALRTDPAFADAHDNLGAALLQMGRVDDAIAELQKALQLQPGLASAHSNLGVALFRKGRVDEAIAQYQTALRSDPEYGQAHNNLGTALIAEGRMAEALTQYEEALRLQPADPNTQNNLALLLATCTEASLRNGDKALQLARQANDLAGGRNPGVLRTLAAALAETRRFGDAVQTAQTALELAQAAGQQELAAHLTGELKRYEAGLPLRQ
jgi:tetratricopeptide (TPR) repeat protein